MPHNLRKTNENESEINLEDKTLFEYVLERDQLEKLINNVGPAEPAKFGKMEAFDDENNKMPHFVLFIALIIFIIIIAYVIFNAMPCNDDIMQIDSVSSGLGQGAGIRAIFVK